MIEIAPSRIYSVVKICLIEKLRFRDERFYPSVNDEYTILNQT